MTDLVQRLRAASWPDAKEAADEIERLRAALRDVLPSERGIHGGPLVQMVATYEDGTEENSARHKGRISHEAVSRARAALSPSTQPDQ